MKPHEVVVLSASDNLRVADGILLSAAQCEVPVDPGLTWSVTKRTLVGGVQEGVELIEVDNGCLRFTIIATRGMSVLDARLGELRFGWNSPIQQIVHPSHMDLGDRSGLGWLGGFNELMVRCGISSAGHPGVESDGHLLTLHGKIGNLPASEVRVSIELDPPHRIRVQGLVEEKTFKFGLFELWTEVSTIPGSNRLQFNDRLINRSDYEQEYQLIYHVNFGPPILQHGSTFLAPFKSVFPFNEYAAEGIDTLHSYLGPTRGYGEQVYCFDPIADEENDSTGLLKNCEGDQAVAVHFGIETLPCFTLWKNTDTLADGYVTGLEPGTGFPYHRSLERLAGRLPRLASSSQIDFRVELEFLNDVASIARVEERINRLQHGHDRQVNRTPPPDGRDGRNEL